MRCCCLHNPKNNLNNEQMHVQSLKYKYGIDLSTANIPIVKKPTDLHSISIDWFLYDGNIDSYWVNVLNAEKKMEVSKYQEALSHVLNLAKVWILTKM